MSRFGRTVTMNKSRAVSREEIVIADLHTEIQRFNVPLALRLCKYQGFLHDQSVDFIGNCQKWCDQALVGLFGPDLIFADVVLMGQLTELRSQIPEALLKRSNNGLSDVEVVFYFYRYHLASSRHKSNIRTLRTRQRKPEQIWSFYVEEWPNDPTSKLLTLTFDHPNLKHLKRGSEQPDATHLFELIGALAAWALQTGHVLAPAYSVLKLLLRTRGEESEFDFFRRKLEEDNMMLYISDDAMEKARGWISEKLIFEGLDDSEYYWENNEKGELSLLPAHIPDLAKTGRLASETFTIDSLKPLPSLSNIDYIRQLSPRSMDQSSTSCRTIFEPHVTEYVGKRKLDFFPRSSSVKTMKVQALDSGSLRAQNTNHELEQSWLDLGKTGVAGQSGFISLAGGDSWMRYRRVSEEEEFENDGTISDSEAYKCCCKVF